MKAKGSLTQGLSPWWRQTVILVLVFGFTILIWLSAKVYHDAPPIPEKVVSTSGETIFTQEEILAGQQIFLKYALMENGTIWGHGAYHLLSRFPSLSPSVVQSSLMNEIAPKRTARGYDFA